MARRAGQTNREAQRGGIEDAEKSEGANDGKDIIALLPWYLACRLVRIETLQDRRPEWPLVTLSTKRDNVGRWLVVGFVQAPFLLQSRMGRIGACLPSCSRPKQAPAFNVECLWIRCSYLFVSVNNT